MGKVLNIFKNESHPAWVFIQQFAIRGLLGVKFLLIARLLNPNDVGLISLALISLTLAESLTEMGILQAVVQNKKKNEYYNVIWTLQFVRGLIIALVLIFLNEILIAFFKEPNAKSILLLTALVPLLKNSNSSKYYYEIRDRKFKKSSIIYGVSSLFDLIASITLISIFKEPLYAIISLITAEFIKSLLTHIVFGWTIKFDFRFKLIHEVVIYGRWIWGNGISSFFVNQFDKLVAASYLGTSSLGMYQMGQKLSQLIVTDISFASGQYLFPQFSQMFNKGGGYIKKYYSKVMILTIIYSFVVSGFIFIYADQCIIIVLGKEWISIAPTIKFLMVSSSLAAITYVSVVYNRAIGKPKKVTLVSYIQLIIFVLFCLLLVKPLKINGLITSSIISYSVGVVLLNFSFKNKILYIVEAIKSNRYLLIVNLTISFFIIIFNNLMTVTPSFIISLILLFCSIYYLGLEFMKSPTYNSTEQSEKKFQFGIK